MLLIHPTTWMNCKCILLNKRKKAQTLHRLLFCSYENLEIKTIVSEYISAVAQGLEKKRWVISKGYKSDILG